MEELFAKSMEFLLSAEGALATIAIVTEFAFRMFKSPKPLSIAYLIADGFRMAGELFSKVGGMLDRVLPQRTEENSEG